MTKPKLAQEFKEYVEKRLASLEEPNADVGCWMLPDSIRMSGRWHEIHDQGYQQAELGSWEVSRFLLKRPERLPGQPGVYMTY